jgi:hypothetical protein
MCRYMLGLALAFVGESLCNEPNGMKTQCKGF